MQWDVVIHTQKYHLRGVGVEKSKHFFSIAMHYWISDTNVPVSNPKVNEIYLCEPIHSTEKKLLYQHISPPPPSKDSSHPPT